MKAYKSVYDEKNKRVSFVTFDVTHQYDFDHEPDTNFYDGLNSHNLHKDSVIEWTAKINREIEEGCLHIKKCKDCGIFFMLPQEEIEWFQDRDMFPPKRCPACRGKRKKNG